MKNASPGLIALLNSKQTFIMADLWTFNLKNGVNLYYTDFDINLTLGAQLFYAKDVLVTGGKLKQSRGLTVNDTDVTCYPDQGSPGPSSYVGSTPFLQAVSNGLFSRALVTRQRIFMPTIGDTSLGAIALFVGEISDVSVTRNTADLKAKDLTNLLNIYMPRRQYQPTCSWVFGDANCGINRAALAITAIATSGTVGSTVKCSLTQVAGTFNNGVIKFTTGINANVVRSVKNWVPGIATLVAPFPNDPAPGDNFTITPGCTKTFNAPTAQFNAAAMSGSTSSVLNLALTNAAGYFNGGHIQGTTGANVGQTVGISLWNPGQAVLTNAFPNTPAIGDQFLLTAVIGNNQGTCTGYWGSNAALHFGGEPFVPVPETAY